MQIPNPLDTIISELKKEIVERIKTELKLFRVESAKHLSESLTWYKEQTNVLKEECKSKDINLGKLSKTFENLTSKKTLLKLRDIQTNLNIPATEPLHRDIMPELPHDSDGIQEEVKKYSNARKSNINLEEQLKQVWLQKKLAFNEYQSQQLGKNSQEKDIFA